MEGEVWRDDSVGRQAAEGAGDGECPAEEVAGGVAARERGGARGATKKMVTVAARRELVRFGQARGLSERRALRMAQLSGSVFRYARRADRNQALRARILDLAH